MSSSLRQIGGSRWKDLKKFICLDVTKRRLPPVGNEGGGDMSEVSSDKRDLQFISSFPSSSIDLRPRQTVIDTENPFN